MLSETFRLPTNATIPAIGLGTSQSHDKEIYDAVSYALKAGYRHIDTAFLYRNEVPVGKAIRDSGIPRADIFVTTKAYSTDFRDVPAALNRSLERLGLDYVDLYLMHLPLARVPDPNDEYSKGLRNDSGITMPEIWESFQNLPQDKVRAIGVSNFTIDHLEKLQAAPTFKTIPAANQVELHPYLPQNELVEYCQKRGIVVEAYSPLVRGWHPEDDDPMSRVLLDLAKKYDADPAKIMLSWNLQRGVVVLPKSVTPSRLDSNFSPVELEAVDVAKISEVKVKPRRVINPVFDGTPLFSPDI